MKSFVKLINRLIGSEKSFQIDIDNFGSNNFINLITSYNAKIKQLCEVISVYFAAF